MTRFRIAMVVFVLGVTASSASAGGGLQGGFIQGGFIQGGFIQGGFIQGNVISAGGDVMGEFDLIGSELVAYRQGTRLRDQIRMHADHHYKRSRKGLKWGPWIGPIAGGGLVGATWQVKVGSYTWDIKIASASIDTESNTMPDHSGNGDVWRYEIKRRWLYGWSNVCYESEDQGMFLAGTWDETGTYDASGLTYGCDSGVAAKCARIWGYKPWKRVEGIHLGGLHRACVRAARADYLDSGVSYTKAGRLVDLVDSYELNRATPPSVLDELIAYFAALYAGIYEFEYEAADFALESVFNEFGCEVVHHARLSAEECGDGRCAIADMIEDAEDYVEGPGMYIKVHSAQTEWPTDPLPWTLSPMPNRL